ncbi:hypothetical protein [uncultured Roseovarius sp.]|uniref:hypothetical protein n=1 Tax=uncultured Roseovarius sp. TaxID=293344 RepID=UPI002609DBE6|nr:hypothetical protein [uncultured Roseovarius sp.]
MTVIFEFKTFKNDTMGQLDRFAHLAPLAANDDMQFGAISNRVQKVCYVLTAALNAVPDDAVSNDHMAVLSDLGRKLNAMFDLSEAVLNTRSEMILPYDERSFVNDIAEYDIEQIGALGDIICGGETDLTKADIAHVGQPLIDTDFFDGPAMFIRIKTILLLILRILVLLKLVPEKTEAKVAELFRVIDDLIELFGGGVVTGAVADNCLDPITVTGISKKAFQFVPDKALYRFRLTERSGAKLGKVEVRVNGVLKTTLDQVGETADVSGRAIVELRLITDDPNARVVISVCVKRPG